MQVADAHTVLLLDLPQSALAGIDLLSFTTTPRFQGVKNLPPDLHFVFVGSSTAFSERHGLWFPVVEKDGPSLFVTKWDSTAETLIAETDKAEILRWRGNLGGIWQQGLTPYRQAAPRSNEDQEVEETGDWNTLTDSITPQLLSRITGHDSDWRLSSASSSKGDLEHIPGLTAEDLNSELQSELHFLPIDLKQTWRDGATGRERTDAAQDRSWFLSNLIEQSCTQQDSKEIIGELQFCFLMVLTLNNFSCFEQWKRILTLLFTCRSATATHSTLFVSAIAALRLQLQHCKDAEGGLIDLADEGGSLLKNLLVRFRRGLETLGGKAAVDVVDELDDLEEYLMSECGWQFGGSHVRSGMLELADGEEIRMDTTAFDEEDETGEFAPQIVDLTPEQARLLGVQSEDITDGPTKTSLLEADDSDKSSKDGQGAASDSETSEDDQDLEEMDARY